MNSIDITEHFRGLIDELCKLPTETGWVEFKVNNTKPEDIGECLSALSNTAALKGREHAYLVWGIHDRTHAIVGTIFELKDAKVGNEDLFPWLRRLLTPDLPFRFHELAHEGKQLVLLEIPRAANSPIQFRGTEFIRIGSYRKKLKDHPAIEKELWRIFDTTPFEELICRDRVTADGVLSLLDYPSYCDLLKQPLPSNRERILDLLQGDRIIVANQAGTWGITNLGAILFAKDLRAFPSLIRKAARVIIYEGKGRLKTIREYERHKGYASDFAELIELVNTLIPRNEVIGQAFRGEVPMYPELAVRELIANALIHQDFHITGAGPMIEVFTNRMEITNPGAPLMSVERFLDMPPRSRNEALASFMRRIGVCEERGSGVDKIVFQTELYQLPAPIFEEVNGQAIRAVLFAHKPLNGMDRVDRSRACYLHACLRYVQQEPMTNSSLRARFGIEEKNSATVSRIIRDTIESGLVAPADPKQGKKYARYLPYWA